MSKQSGTIEVRRNEDGSVVLMTAPEHALISKELLKSSPFIRVKQDVIYIDAANPKLYQIVGGDDKVAEVRRIFT